MTTEQIDATDAPKKPSRLHKALERADRTDQGPGDGVERAEYVEDFTTADERLASFWRKYSKADVDFKSRSIRVDKIGGQVEWTVHVTIRIDDGTVRKVTASATRSSTDPNDIVAHNPHETAQTAALSRALRFLGIKLQKRSAKP